MWNIFHLDKLFSLNQDRIYYGTLSLPKTQVEFLKEEMMRINIEVTHGSQNFSIQIRNKLKFMTFAWLQKLMTARWRRLF